jgi:hypothetical protein
MGSAISSRYFPFVANFAVCCCSRTTVASKSLAVGLTAPLPASAAWIAAIKAAGPHKLFESSLKKGPE